MFLNRGQFVPLHYRVRFPVVLKYFGQLLLAFAISVTMPLATALILGDYQLVPWYLGIMVGIAVPSYFLSRLEASRNIGMNEALVITVLIFTIPALVMTIPLVVSGLPFIDSLFETISAVTTTGLSNLTEHSAVPATTLFSRAWQQWIGGLGFVVLALAIMPEAGIASRRLSEYHIQEDNLLGSTHTRAKMIFYVYLSLTIVGILLLLLQGVDFFSAVTYTMSAVSTGGFSIHEKSLGYFSFPTVPYTIMIISMMGSVSFALYYGAARGKMNTTYFLEFIAFIIFSLVFSIILIFTFHSNMKMDWLEAIYHGPISAMSAQSTAGFASFPMNRLDNGSLYILIFSMVIGGGAASTAGGVKILRVLIFIRYILNLIRKIGMPRKAKLYMKIGGKSMDQESALDAIVVIFLFLIVIFLSWGVFLVMGYPPLQSLFDVVSATATVGLSAGVSGPDLPGILKLLLCFDMLCGRLEVVAILVFLYPGTWTGRRRSA